MALGCGIKGLKSDLVHRNALVCESNVQLWLLSFMVESQVAAAVVSSRWAASAAGCGRDCRDQQVGQRCWLGCRGDEQLVDRE